MCEKQIQQIDWSNKKWKLGTIGKCSNRTAVSDVRGSFTGNEKVQLNADLFNTNQEDNKIEDNVYNETLGMTT